MKRIVMRFSVLFLCLVFFTVSVQSQVTPRILLVGDSWPDIMWNERSFQKVLDQSGLSQFEEKGSVTSISGTTAQQWIQPAYLHSINDEMEKYPTIDIVCLWIGGNDFVPSIKASDTKQQIDNLKANILNNISTIADHVLSIRSDIRLLLVDYDYLAVALPGFSFAEINQIINVFAKQKLELTEIKDRMFYLSNFGLMQHTYGVPNQYAAGELPAPGGPPNHDPIGGGDPNYGSPASAYRDFLHLTTEGYLVLAQRCVDMYLEDWLLHPMDQSSVQSWELFN